MNDKQQPVELASEMTLRDYFAAKAMQGMVSVETAWRCEKTLAPLAYEIADRMLQEREK